MSCICFYHITFCDYSLQLSIIILAQIFTFVCCSTFIKSVLIISFTETSLRRRFGTAVYKNLAISFSVIIPKGLLSLAITTLLISSCYELRKEFGLVLV